MFAFAGFTVKPGSASILEFAKSMVLQWDKKGIFFSFLSNAMWDIFSVHQLGCLAEAPCESVFRDPGVLEGEERRGERC